MAPAMGGPIRLLTPVDAYIIPMVVAIPSIPIIIIN
jgi:hypothetical protein